MTIAIDVSPLQSGHKVRGVGFYLSNLLAALHKYHPEHTICTFTNSKDIPEDADVVHYPYFEPFFLTLPIKFKKPTVITIHDLTPLKYPKLFPAGKKGLLKWQIQKRFAKNASAIITDSESSKKDIHQLLQLPLEKIHAIYLAAAPHFQNVDLSEKERKLLQEKYRLPEKFILYVGDVTPNKNLPVLLNAVEKVSVPLVMVGKSLASSEYDKSNPWNRDLIEVQKRAQANSRLHILGFVPDEDLVMLYNLASVFVMPSFSEGFGLPLVEAMSCGTPSITTKESSLPEVGRDAVLYANHDDSDDFAEKIATLLKNENLAKELSKKGIERVKEFSWEKTTKETVKVYEKVGKK